MRNGIIAEFTDPEDLLDAARAMRARGYRGIDAITPYMVDGLDEALALRRTRIPAVALAAALTGVAFALFVQWWCNAVAYPLNIGGRPRFALPAWVPIMFETSVLFTALSVFVLVLVRNRLPRLHGALDELEGIERTSIDRFWLTLAYPDQGYDREVPEQLRARGAVAVWTVGSVP